MSFSSMPGLRVPEEPLAAPDAPLLKDKERGLL